MQIKLYKNIIIKMLIVLIVANWRIQKDKFQIGVTLKVTCYA